MPELPEVETIKRQLLHSLKGKKITAVEIFQARVIKSPSPKEFQKEISGTAINQVLRKGKAIVLELSSGKSLIVQLGMTGQLVYPGKGAADSRVSFKLNNGEFLDFKDNRMFGGLSLVSGWREFPYIKNLGPEPFGLSAKEFQEMLSKKTTRIKLLLMDQQFLSGAGNIYANEALFRSCIDPQRPGKSLSPKEAASLLKEIKDTLNEAIEHGGSSVDDYIQLSGEKGDYSSYHKVYDREGKECLKCSTKVKKIVLGGRGTFFCQKCQK